MDIPVIEKRGKDAQVIDYIFSKVKGNEWPAGTKLPNEFELAESLNVSRVSIRQAVSQLKGQGILTVKHGEGTFVNEIGPGNYFDNVLKLMVLDAPEYIEVQEFRMMIEPMIAFAICEKCTEENIRILEECIAHQSQALKEKDQQAFAMEDSRFHRLLAEFTQNGLIIRIIDWVQEILQEAMKHSTQLIGYGDSIEYHAEILQKISENDSMGAAKVMWTHIRNNITSYNERMKQGIAYKNESPGATIDSQD